MHFSEIQVSPLKVLMVKEIRKLLFYIGKTEWNIITVLNVVKFLSEDILWLSL